MPRPAAAKRAPLSQVRIYREDLELVAQLRASRGVEAAMLLRQLLWAAAGRGTPTGAPVEGPDETRK